MKTREEVIKKIQNKIPAFVPMTVGTELGNDLHLIQVYANCHDYLLGMSDAFAIGYMAGQSNLTSIFNNEEKLKEAVNKYDTTDATNRFDTVGETLADLFNFNLK